MIALGIFLAYLLGSVPNAYWFARMYRSIDIRQHGSGNVGATNVFRVLGKGPGIFILVLDILKGLLAVTWLADMLSLTAVWHRLLMAVAVVAGHNWTVFLKFRGGKGIATSLGVLTGLAVTIPAIQPVLFGTLLVWAGVFLFSRFVSLASIVASVCLPILMVATAQKFSIVLVGIVFCIFVVFRHRPNIKRLLAGQEPRVNLPFWGSNKP